METVLVVTRHPLTAAKTEWLGRKFPNANILVQDIKYGDDPVGAVNKVIKNNANVIAIVPIAPFPALMKIVNELGKDYIVLKEEFVRDAGGRVKVIGKEESGRDVFQFDRYVRLKKIVFETEEI